MKNSSNHILKEMNLVTKVQFNIIYRIKITKILLSLNLVLKRKQSHKVNKIGNLTKETNNLYKLHYNIREIL